MQFLEEVDSATIERLKEQEEFLLRIYQAEFSKDPSGRATESSRSNLIALRHTLKQMYGESVASDVSRKVGAEVEVTVAAEPEATIPKKTA